MAIADPCVTRILELLENRGVKQKFIPKLLGKPEYVSLVTDWKHGKSKPSDRDLEVIAINYGVSVQWLKTGNDDSKKNMLTRDGNTGEQELLNLFRCVSERDQGIVLETLRRMADTVPVKEKEGHTSSGEQAV